MVISLSLSKFWFAIHFIWFSGINYAEKHERHMQFANQLMNFARKFLWRDYYWIVFVYPKLTKDKVWMADSKYWETLDILAYKPCNCTINANVFVRKEVDTTLCPRNVYDKLKSIQEESRNTTNSTQALFNEIKSQFESRFRDTKIKPGMIITYKQGALIWKFKHGSCSNYDNEPLVNEGGNNKGIKSFVVAQGWSPRTFKFQLE